MENATLYGSQISAPPIEAPVAVRYCLYARKSSEAEEKQALSVESQVKEMLSVATKNGINVAEIYRESHSAKDCGMRPVFNQLISDLLSRLIAKLPPRAALLIFSLCATATGAGRGYGIA